MTIQEAKDLLKEIGVLQTPVIVNHIVEENKPLPPGNIDGGTF